MLYRLTTSHRADEVVVTDVSDCSEELNAVIQNTIFVSSKTCRRTVGHVFLYYVQETDSGGYEVGTNKHSPCAVCSSLVFNIICVFV